MPRPPEILLLHVLRAEHAARQRAVLRADSSRCAGVVRIDRERVRRALGVFVVDHHLREFEVDAQCRHEGRTDETGGVSDHERHLLCRDVLGSDDEIALILASGIVEYDYEFAIFCDFLLVRGSHGVFLDPRERECGVIEKSFETY